MYPNENNVDEPYCECPYGTELKEGEDFCSCIAYDSFLPEDDDTNTCKCEVEGAVVDYDLLVPSCKCTVRHAIIHENADRIYECTCPAGTVEEDGECVCEREGQVFSEEEYEKLDIDSITVIDNGL